MNSNELEAEAVETEAIEVDDNVQSGDLPMIPIQYMRDITQHTKLLIQFKYAIIAQTCTSDWVKFGNYFYLQSSGGQRIAGPLAISWHGDDGENSHPTLSREDQGDGSYAWIVSGWFIHKDPSGVTRRRIPIIGRCYSDDQFMYNKKLSEVRKAYNVQWDNKLKQYEPLPEGAEVVIKEQDVKDKALANFISRGVSVTGGLKNVTADMLVEAKRLYPEARIDLGKLTEVDFGSGKGTTTNKNARAAQSGGASTDTITELRETIQEVARITDESLDDVLRRCSYFKAGDGKEVWAKSFSKVTASWAPKILVKAKEELQQLHSAQAASQSEIPLPEDPGGA